MKKQVVVVAAIAGLALGAAIAQAGDSKGAGIVGSVHDLNGGTFATAGVQDAGKRICAFCHSPHHSAQDNQQASADVSNLGGAGVVAQYKVYAPLWSRPVDMAADYGTYVSQTFNPLAQDKAYDPLIGPSRLCMTCHDGVVALDAYYGNNSSLETYTGGDTFSGGITAGGGEIGIGVNMGLANDHPIGMKYDDFYNKTDENGTTYELMDPATTFKGTEASFVGKSITSVLYSDPQDTNVKGFVTCASCHDVHNGKAVGNKNPAGSMRGFLLYGSQVQSSFCLTCHDKNGIQGVPSGVN